MQILRRGEARKRGGFSKTTEWRLSHSDPTYPKIVRLSPGLTGYLEHEFDDWLAARPRVDDSEAQRSVETSEGDPG
jgi:predicted DNA-binding transcriptional regulator AlpA